MVDVAFILGGLGGRAPKVREWLNRDTPLSAFGLPFSIISTLFKVHPTSAETTDGTIRAHQLPKDHFGEVCKSFSFSRSEARLRDTPPFPLAS